MMTGANDGGERPEVNAQAAARRFWRRVIAVALAGVVVPVGAGVVGTVLGMVRAFATLGATGAADPAELSESVSRSLFWTAVGLGVAGVSFLVLIGAMIRYGASAK